MNCVREDISSRKIEETLHFLVQEMSKKEQLELLNDLIQDEVIRDLAEQFLGYGSIM